MPNTLTLHDLYWVLGEQNLGPLEFYFAEALKKNGFNVNYFNIHELYNNNWKKLNGYSHRFPRKYDNLIHDKYLKVVNDAIIKKYSEEKPSHIFIYNDCKVLPATIDLFKKNGTRIIVFLGDDPNYLLPGKKTFVLNVMKADAVITPDTGWIDNLKMLGIKKIIFSPVGTDASVFYPLDPDENSLRKYKCDVIFIGTGYYMNSWGIKRAAVLNAISDLDLKLFGDRSWHELFRYFPALKGKYTEQSLNSKEVNIACNCSKIYPVTVNSGIVNGVTTRVFDCMASGIFTISEYKKDFDSLFTDNEAITFKSIAELKDKTEYYLKNENERKELTQRARETVLKKYTLETLVKNITGQI